jgi:hypothetical protein
MVKVEKVIDLTLECDDVDAPPSKRQRSLCGEEPPHELRCPISQTMFRDPVMVFASGHAYEIQAVRDLYWAAEEGHERVAKILLENGAAVDVKDNIDRTALHIAAQFGHEPVAKLFLENGAAVDAKDKYDWTALHWAAENGHEHVTKLLLENGAAVDAKDKEDWTALRWAEFQGHESVIKLLLENGAA